MAHGNPDWVRMVQVAVTVENVPIVPEPATEVAAGDAGNYNDKDGTYQPLASWTVPDEKVGELKEILIISDDYEHTWIKITIADEVWKNDWNPTSSMPIIFEDLKLAPNSEVKVEVKSDGTNTIAVDAIIVGKEIG